MGLFLRQRSRPLLQLAEVCVAIFRRTHRRRDLLVVVVDAEELGIALHFRRSLKEDAARALRIQLLSILLGLLDRHQGFGAALATRRQRVVGPHPFEPS